jgi:hypothetical protein
MNLQKQDEERSDEEQKEEAEQKEERSDVEAELGEERSEEELGEEAEQDVEQEPGELDNQLMLRHRKHMKECLPDYELNLIMKLSYNRLDLLSNILWK